MPMMRIPQAQGFEVEFCGACPNAHLLYYDSAGKFICQATISAAQADRIAKLIRNRDPNFKETGAET